MTRLRIIFALELWIGLATLATGCRKDASPYTPAPQTARASLEAALAAWQEGRPAGTLSAGERTIEVVDTTRVQRPKLGSFKVLSETSVSGQGRCFVVRLGFANPSIDSPAEELRERYVVVGIDPIWVFRKEDYDMLAHWEHPMEAPPTPTTPTGDSAAEETPPAAATTASPTTDDRS